LNRWQLILAPYHAVQGLRNQLYDRGVLPSHALGRWTISVGNISFGGTGKTPLVIHLAERLRHRGHHPAILLRGYRSTNGLSDEAALLQDKLPGIPVIADPDRIAGAAAALKTQPPPDLFILDDAFQHRRAQRDVNVVLLNAGRHTQQLLRESPSALRRATAIVLTHASQTASLATIESEVRRFNASAPVLHCDHVLLSLLDAANAEFPMTELANRRFIIATAIGDAASFSASIEKYAKPLAHMTLSDHHPFDAPTVAQIQNLAKSHAAETIVVTEKDWTKLARHPAGRIPILRVRLGLHFFPGDDDKLLDIVRPKH